jgi:phosphatidylglycerol:prolipoprotein diacylglycerol transferase
MPFPDAPSAYSWLMLVAILFSGWLMWRLRRRNSALLSVYLVTLAGSFLGAKVVYLAAEGWLYSDHPDKWRIWLTGKTVLGALLFGYPFAEWAKKFFGYQGTTGDFFALAVIPGIIIGRIGCLTQGCCAGTVCEPAWWTLRDAAGVDRWPSVPVEIAFNLVALSVVFTLHRFGKMKGQLFHLYLMGTGVFRFSHEFIRDTPRILGPLSGYHLAAAGVFALGLWGYRKRARASTPAAISSAAGD